VSAHKGIIRVPHGKLGHRALAKQYSAGCTQAAHNRRVLGRDPVGEDLRAGGRAHPGCGEQVLETQWDAVQRPAIIARHQLRFGTARRGAGVIGHERQIGVDVGIPVLDAREIGLRQLHRRERPVMEEITRRA
jgi:hypothetical protein